MGVVALQVFPESTDSCRFVCDGGNGGSYRNVATVTREQMSKEGKYHCEISELLPGREYRVLAIARTRFKPCHGAQTMFDTKAVFRTKAAVPTAPTPQQEAGLMQHTHTARGMHARDMHARDMPHAHATCQLAA